MRAYQEERSNLRGLRRTFDVSPTVVITTVISWLKKVAALELRETLVETPGEKVLELDELWSFV